MKKVKKLVIKNSKKASEEAFNEAFETEFELESSKTPFSIDKDMLREELMNHYEFYQEVAKRFCAVVLTRIFDSEKKEN